MKCIKMDISKPINFESCGRFMSSKQWSHPNRIISTYVIIIGLEGVAHIQMDDEKYEIKPNTSLLLLPNLLHFGYEEDKNLSYLWCHFSSDNHFEIVDIPEADYIKSFPECNCLFMPLYNKDISDDTSKVLLRQVLHMANRTFKTDQLMNYILTSLLLEISEEVYIKAQRIYISNIEENHFSEILEWIRINMRNNISLTEVANYFHYNPEYFSRLFKRNTKQTFIRYLMGIRLMKARDLLINTTMGIKEIAFYVGYNNPKYFMKVFKYSEQMTPSEYRNTMYITHLNNL
jgi:YesN/AraC family two-component response regulator